MLIGQTARSCRRCCRIAEQTNPGRLPVLLMDIINTTPHSIAIYGAGAADFRPDLRKHILRDGAEPLRVIPPSGMLLNAQMAPEPSVPVEGIPTFTAVPSAVDAPPESGWLIVSRMYAAAVAAVEPLHGGPDAAACSAVGRLLVVHQPVYRLGDDGTTAPVGCLGFERV